MSIRSIFASFIGKMTQEKETSTTHTSGSSEIDPDPTHNDVGTGGAAPSIETRSVESDSPILSVDSARLNPETGPRIEDLFGLLVTGNLCPDPLKGYSAAEGEWQELSSHLRRMYDNYLSSSEYTGDGSSDEDSYFTWESPRGVLYFGQPLAASFNHMSTGTDKRLVTLYLRVLENGYSCAPLDPAQGLQRDHESLGKKLMKAIRGESDDREKAIAKLLRKIPFHSSATVNVIELEDQTAAWCTALMSKMTLFYGVIQHSKASDHESASSVSTDDSWAQLENDEGDSAVSGMEG